MTAGSGSSPFPTEVVEAVCAHMNGDHADDSLLIVRTLGARPEATAASMTGFDGTAATFSVTVDGAEEQVRIPWSVPITERGAVRAEVVRMYHEACAAAGIEPRPSGEH